jgi:hypothetical protein
MAEYHMVSILRTISSSDGTPEQQQAGCQSINVFNREGSWQTCQLPFHIHVHPCTAVQSLPQSKISY